MDIKQIIREEVENLEEKSFGDTIVSTFFKDPKGLDSEMKSIADEINQVIQSQSKTKKVQPEERKKATYNFMDRLKSMVLIGA